MDEEARPPAATGAVNHGPPAPARSRVSRIRQVPWCCLGTLSGYAAFAVPFDREINTNGEWGWLVVLSTWLVLLPIWLTCAVLLVVLPRRPGTRRRAYGVGLIVGPPLLVLYEGTLALGIGFLL